MNEGAGDEQPALRVEVFCVDHQATISLVQRDPEELRLDIAAFFHLHGDCRTSIDLSGAPGLRLDS